MFHGLRCNLFGCRQIQRGVNSDNSITQVETGEGNAKERDRSYKETNVGKCKVSSDGAVELAFHMRRKICV